MSKVTLMIHDLTEEQYEAINLKEGESGDGWCGWKEIETSSIRITMFRPREDSK
jgi:hypothetical protein